MELAPHIRQLIAAHDYVVIPGFGGFVGKYAPAHIHPGTHEFSPPNKSLAFNRNLTNDDGLLVQQLTHYAQLSNNEAQQAIQQFANDLNQKLEQGEVAKLEGIGRIYRDMEGRIRFKQDEEAVLLSTSYGLPRFKAAPVLRKKLVDTGPAIKTEEDTEPKKRAVPTWLWAAAAVGVTLVIIFGSYFAIPGMQKKTNQLMGWNGNNGPTTTMSTTMMPVQVDAIDWNLDNFIMRVYPDLPREVLMPYEVTVNSNIPSGYYIVVGSFQDRSNANDLLQAMKRDGWDAFLFPTADNGFNRVGLFITKSNLHETSQLLSEIRTTYREDAWVVKNLGE